EIERVFEGARGTARRVTRIVPALEGDDENSPVEVICHPSRIGAGSARSSVNLTLVTFALPAAVLWDMDGTLIDSEPYWMHAEEQLVTSFGGEWTTEDGHDLVGSGLYQSASIFQRKGVALSATEIVETLSNSVLNQLR